MRRYCVTECTKRRVVGGLSDLIGFSETVYVGFLYLFLLAFYFRILILYTTDFNPKINKGIILYIYSGTAIT